MLKNLGYRQNATQGHFWSVNSWFELLDCYCSRGKDSIIPYYLTVAEGKKDEFPEGINANWNANSLLQNWDQSHRSFFEKKKKKR